MNGTSIVMLITWCFIILFAVVFLVLITKDEKADDMGGYDERQLLARGRATQAAMFAGIGYLFLLQFAELWEGFPLTMQEVSIIGIVVMVVTFETVAIWKDAYLQLREKEGTSIGWTVAIGIVNLIGRTSLVSLLVGGAFLYTAFLIALRRFLRKREEREEDDG